MNARCHHQNSVDRQIQSLSFASYMAYKHWTGGNWTRLWVLTRICEDNTCFQTTPCRAFNVLRRFEPVSGGKIPIARLICHSWVNRLLQDYTPPDSHGMCWHSFSPHTETEMLSFWWNFNHWLHRKLSFWQLSVQPVMKISSKWRHFCFSAVSQLILHSQQFDWNTKTIIKNPQKHHHVYS